MSQLQTHTISETEDFDFDFTSLLIPVNPQEAQWIMANSSLTIYPSEDFTAEFAKIKLKTVGNPNKICASCW